MFRLFNLRLIWLQNISALRYQKKQIWKLYEKMREKQAMYLHRHKADFKKVLVFSLS